jgi:hypothetical protein
MYERRFYYLMFAEELFSLKRLDWALRAYRNSDFHSGSVPAVLLLQQAKL